MMDCYEIKFRTGAAQIHCGLCGRQTKSGPGPELFVAESAAPVCRDCGRNVAPELTALLGLGQVAERVGRMKRHTLVPPLEALLELAGAAESYASHTAALKSAPQGLEVLNAA
jgi:ribosome-binding protein aMBF1 (putative translation factor)